MEKLIVASRKQLARCQELSSRWQLQLTEADWEVLGEQRHKALLATGRVEFGEGVLPLLVQAFASSPYIWQANYTETLAQLQELFYVTKNECGDVLSDEELCAFLARVFNGEAGGSLEYLADAAVECLCRELRERHV